jgi:protein phosphatase
VAGKMAGLNLEVSFKTDVGMRRDHNEDSCISDVFLDPEIGKMAILGIADGMGGFTRGEAASSIAISSVRDFFREKPIERLVIEEKLRKSFERVGEQILSMSRVESERSGTTFTVGIYAENNLHIAHVGDTRAYLIREGSIRQITEDHSWVEEQVGKGLMTSEQALASPYRNVLTRSIGTGEDSAPDFFHIELKHGDHVVFCSDGLSNMIADREILHLATSSPDLNRACEDMVHLANERGGKDNITVIVARFTSRGIRFPLPRLPGIIAMLLEERPLLRILSILITIASFALSFLVTNEYLKASPGEREILFQSKAADSIRRITWNGKEVHIGKEQLEILPGDNFLVVRLAKPADARLIIEGPGTVRLKNWGGVVYMRGDTILCPTMAEIRESDSPPSIMLKQISDPFVAAFEGCGRIRKIKFFAR